MKKPKPKIYLLVLDEGAYPVEVRGPFEEENEQKEVEGVLRENPAVLLEEGSGTIIRMVFQQGRGAASYYRAGWLDQLRGKVQDEISCNRAR